MLVCINGTFLKPREAKISVFDHGFLYGDGVYETLRTHGGKVFQMEEHMKRLEQSAKLMGMGLPYGREKIERWIYDLVQRREFSEMRIRVQVTRGQNGFDFGPAQKGTVVITGERLIELDGKMHKEGVKVVTFEGARMVPRVKSTSMLPMIMARRFAEKVGVFEAIFVDGGWVREGSISNVFVVKKGVVMTPRDGILFGITRKVVLQLARKLNLKVIEGDFTKRKLYNADEIFITSSVKGIVPVREVDGQKIGNGRPGLVVKSLMNAFDEYIAKNSG